MSSNPLVSVIVPVYNKEQYIAECLDSILGQTYRNIEAVLVDDKSTDSSRDICREYMQKDNRIILADASGKGPAEACRVGVDASTGEYACFVDSDDWIDLDMVERLIAHATGSDDEIILSDYVIERTNGARTYVYQDIMPGEYDRGRIIDEVFPKLWGLEDRAVSQSRCMKLYSMGLVRRNISYPEPDLKFAEDGAFLLPCVMDAQRMFFLDRAAMYHYRYVDDSSVHRYSPNVSGDIRRVRVIINRAITDKFSSEPDVEERLKNLYRAESVILLMYAVKNALRSDKKDYIDEIRDLCSEPENKLALNECPVRFSHPINCLIYRTMKHPTTVNCRILKLLMDLHG